MNQENTLLQAIYANPDDDAPRLIYADWLDEKGQADWADFIRVQCALEAPARSVAERLSLQEREAILLRAHETAWLGEVLAATLNREVLTAPRWEGDVPNFGHRFARGWLDRIDLPILNVAVTRELVRRPVAHLLRHLGVDFLAYEEGEYEPGPDVPAGKLHPALYPLIRSGALTNLRSLRIGAWPDEELHHFNSESSVEGLVGLVRLQPRIEEIYLFAQFDSTDRLFALPNLDNLRTIQIYHLHEYAWGTLAKNPALARLEKLLIHPGRQEEWENGYMTPDDLRAVLESPHLWALTHLQLRLLNFGDTACELLVRTGALKRLKWLDLQHGIMTDTGARLLAACPEVKNLEYLNVNDNALTAVGITALRHAGVRGLHAGGQHALDDEHWRYMADIE